MGNIFRDYHLDFKMRYPETNQFTINIDSIQDSELRDALKAAVRWTIIQRKSNLQRSSPGPGLHDIYTINRIFSPSFQISYRTGGGVSIELNEASLKKLMHDDKEKLREFILPGDVQANEEHKNNSGDLFSNT